MIDPYYAAKYSEQDHAKLNEDPLSYIYHGSTGGKILLPEHQANDAVFIADCSQMLEEEFAYNFSASEVKTIDLSYSPDKPDHGAGFYTGDEDYAAQVWAAHRELSYAGFVNIYSIDDGFYDYAPNGVILNFNFLNQNSIHNLLTWALDVAESRLDDADYDVDNVRDNWTLLADAYESLRTILLESDWIVSKRSDDSFWSFSQAFFQNQISIAELWVSAMECAMGDQLVVKSPRALDCVSWVDGYYFEKSNLKNKYYEIYEYKRQLYRKIINNFQLPPGRARWIVRNLPGLREVRTLSTADSTNGALAGRSDG